MSRIALVLVFASGVGCNVPEVNYIVTDAAFPSIALRDGEDGYAGTKDTYIESPQPNLVHGSDLEMQWGLTGNAHALIRFDDLFPDRIPTGSTIHDALLELHVNTSGSSAGMLYEVTSNWDESTTYSTFGPTAGVSTEDRAAQQVALVDGSATGKVAIHVGASVQRWLQAPTSNKGWIILPNDAAGVSVVSSDANNPDLRPTLIVVLSN